jgi:hypothetical protein
MKQFLIKISYTVLPLLLFFYAVAAIYKFEIKPRESGDLGRIGKIPFGKEYDLMLEQHHLKNLMVDDFGGEEIQSGTYDIITIGDSFSGRGVSGYQNYLAHLRNKRILNIKDMNDTPEQCAVMLMNNGFLERLSPKWVIVESVEREFADRLLSLNLSGNFPLGDMLARYEADTVKPVADKQPLLYETLNFIRLYLQYNSPVKRTKLTDSLFSVRDDRLFFYKYDLQRTNIGDNESDTIHETIDAMKQKLSSKGVKFIYVVAANKYDVYESFIENNPYPINHTLDHFRALESTAYFINTKALLQPLLKAGVKDVYLANDSHWSYIASETLAGKIRQIMDEE